MTTIIIPETTSRDADFLLFSIIFGPIHSLLIRFPYVNILYFLLFHLSLSELCLFLCPFSVRWHAHVDFLLFLQKSSGIPELELEVTVSSLCRTHTATHSYRLTVHAEYSDQESITDLHPCTADVTATFFHSHK